METIAKQESVLELELTAHPQNVGTGYAPIGRSHPHFLNDSCGEEVKEGIKTSHLVDGYKRRKKK